MLVSSDTHYGTKSDVERNQDIHRTQLEIVQYAIDTKQELYIIMGDIFDIENPPSQMIAKVTQWITMLEKNKIKTFILRGNHDGKREVHALSFIKEMKLKYVEVIDEPKIQTLYIEKINRNINLIFLPYIEKNFVIRKNKELINNETDRNRIQKLKDVDLYLEQFADYAINYISENKDLSFVFAHLNVDGALLGPDDLDFKVNKHNIPKKLRQCKNIIYIFCGHIHKFQIVQNKGEIPVILPGSIQTRRFDERNDEKTFIEVKLEELLDE